MRDEVGQSSKSQANDRDHGVRRHCGVEPPVRGSFTKPLETERAEPVKLWANEQIVDEQLFEREG
jgi:hypothetical protein